MALPRTLKNFNLFNDGDSYLGQVEEITLPTLTRNTEDYRAGGMMGPVKLDMGQEAIECEWKCGGLMRGVLAQYGITKPDGVQLRFAGAYQSEDTGEIDAVELVIRGRHTEINFGSAKVGEKTEFTIKTAASYYKLSIKGSPLIEIDLVNMVENINGKDQLTAIRQALGI